jgi:hypothetical protein
VPSGFLQIVPYFLLNILDLASHLHEEDAQDDARYRGEERDVGGGVNPRLNGAS